MKYINCSVCDDSLCVAEQIETNIKKCWLNRNFYPMEIQSKSIFRKSKKLNA